MKINFWGCRGTCAITDGEMSKYGGNTPCVSVECADSLIVFDMGTGLLKLSEYVMKTYNNKEVNIFISHYHLDHIEGVAFAPFVYEPQYKINFYGKRVMGLSPKETIEKLFSPPFFPIPLTGEDRTERHSYYEITDNEAVRFREGEIAVSNIPVNHPGGSNAYKVTYDGKSVIYLSDYENTDEVDKGLIDFIYGGDLVILDAYFTPENFKKGWGHSTWETGVKLLKEANLKSLCLYHHHITMTDKELDDIEKKIKKVSDKLFIAKEGMSLKI